MAENENAEEKKHYELRADSNVFLDVEQMTLASEFLRKVLDEVDGDKTWINNAMGVGSHSSKFMGQVFGESATYRAAQWLFVVNRVFWRLPVASRERLSSAFMEVLHDMAYPKLSVPKPKVKLDTEPEVVKKRRKKVMEERL